MTVPLEWGECTMNVFAVFSHSWTQMATLLPVGRTARLGGPRAVYGRPRGRWNRSSRRSAGRNRRCLAYHESRERRRNRQETRSGSLDRSRPSSYQTCLAVDTPPRIIYQVNQFDPFWSRIPSSYLIDIARIFRDRHAAISSSGSTRKRTSWNLTHPCGNRG